MRVLLLFVPVPLVHEEQAGVAIPSALDGAPSGDPQQCGEPSRAPYDVGEAGVATDEYTSLNKRRVRHGCGDRFEPFERNFLIYRHHRDMFVVHPIRVYVRVTCCYIHEEQYRVCRVCERETRLPFAVAAIAIAR